MRIIQVLTTLSFGDAVGNDTLAIMGLLRKNGYADTGIYAENLDPRMATIEGVHKVDELPQLAPDDVMIYHLSTGSNLNRKIKDFNCRKLVRYHNVTPANFFEKYSEVTARLCSKGRSEVKSLNQTFDAGICVSDYNRQELIEMGYTCDMSVCPILIPFDDYKKTPDSEVISKYSDGVKNIVFVGRIAPNKKQEDLIALTATYKKLYPDEKIRLILVGSARGTENYDKRLKDYVELLGLDNVVFSGQVSFASILAFYKVADVFVCMSEHEGFCVPLIEAMCFEKPIVAADYAAIAGTLGGSGILLEKKDMVKAAFYVHEILNDKELANSVVEGQNNRLKDFSYEAVSTLLMEQINRFVRGEAL
ncbi:MAG: glycosyltransferase family 4 protein [Clostridia bacterium]|nr:glycosyltransferase family 4 protein [Clostridia bacterium]